VSIVNGSWAHLSRAHFLLFAVLRRRKRRESFEAPLRHSSSGLYHRLLSRE
jgi:hypothetical protein